MTTRGGKREGSGGYEGQIKPKFFSFVAPDEVQKYMDWVLKKYKKDTKLAIWLGDHLFGKAVQPIGNDEDKPFKIQGVEITIRK